jgi:hypothetical protein
VFMVRNLLLVSVPLNQNLLTAEAKRSSLFYIIILYRGYEVSLNTCIL